MRILSTTLALLLLVRFSHALPPGTAAKGTKPNIIFILADDLGQMDIGAFNPKTFYETPNIDGLAKRGMKFTQGYAACCVCSPTRGSIMTGKYPPRFGSFGMCALVSHDAVSRDRFQIAVPGATASLPRHRRDGLFASGSALPPP